MRSEMEKRTLVKETGAPGLSACGARERKPKPGLNSNQVGGKRAEGNAGLNQQEARKH